MKDKIKEVLARHGKNQTNLASESAQNLIADELQREIVGRPSPCDIEILDEIRAWLSE